MDLELLQQNLRQFAAERDWERFHTPKNLAIALMVEAAELAEIFQWMTPEQSMFAHSDKVEQERIGDEVADVLLYLLQLADHCHIDLKRAVDRKLIKNAKKHPPTKPGLPAVPAVPGKNAAKAMSPTAAKKAPARQPPETAIVMSKPSTVQASVDVQA